MAEEQTPVDANELIRLRALVADYETKMTDAAALVARVRHEINNPLAALLGQAQLLLREELAGKTRDRAETIEKLAIRIKKLSANCVRCRRRWRRLIERMNKDLGVRRQSAAATGAQASRLQLPR